MPRSTLVLVLVLAGCSAESPTESPVSPPPNAPAPLPVHISTRGIDPGTSSFRLAIDNLADRQAPVNGTTTFSVTPGRHLVRLHQLPNHCQIAVPGSSLVQFAWERTVAVVTPDPASFSVHCFLIGTLRLELQTSGSHAPSLYIALLSNHPDAVLELPVNGSLTVQNVQAGMHQLSISTGPNCLVSDPNLSGRVTVDISPSQTTTVRIPVACS